MIEGRHERRREESQIRVSKKRKAQMCANPIYFGSAVTNNAIFRSVAASVSACVLGVTYERDGKADSSSTLTCGCEE